MSRKAYEAWAQATVVDRGQVGVVSDGDFYPLAPEFQLGIDLRPVRGNAVVLREQVLKHSRGLTEASPDGGRTWQALNWTHRRPVQPDR